MKYERLQNPDYSAEIQESAEARKREKYIKEIRRLIQELDIPEKALTGRKVESYEMGSGVLESELFPEGGKVLNIGDPWQTLDLPNVLSIDYETGEEALFPSTYEQAIEDFDDRREKLLGVIDGNIVGRLTEIADLGFSPANDLLISWREVQRAVGSNDLENMSKFADVGQQVFDFGHEMSAFRKEYEEWEKEQEDVDRDDDVHFMESWYKVQDLGRLYADAHTWEYEVGPAIAQEAVRNKGLSDEEEREIVRRVVAQERFLKKTKYADFKKGAWPEVWFPDESFDRITASWSLSAHVFREMKPEHHKFYFDEMDRVLKEEGCAYIWPLGYWYDNFDDLYDGIQKYIEEGGDVGLIINNELITYKSGGGDFMYELEENFRSEPTLVVFKKGAKPEALERVRQALLEPESGWEEEDGHEKEGDEY